MARWMFGTVVVFLVIFSVTVILTGDAIYIIPVAVLAALVLGYAMFNRVLTRRIEARHDSMDEAMADETESIPATHLITDDRTPVGDTPEAHDEINPHDLPKDHPGRAAAEEQASDRDGAPERTTRGNQDRDASARDERVS